MVASIPWIYSAPNCSVNTILICYQHSQIPELCHNLKGYTFGEERTTINRYNSLLQKIHLFQGFPPLLASHSCIQINIKYYTNAVKLVKWKCIYLPRINSLQHWPTSLPSQPSIDFWSSFVFSSAACRLARPCIRTPVSLEMQVHCYVV
jgi:hypothetical protein